MKNKKIYINNLFLTFAVMMFFIIGISCAILSKPEFKWYEIIILPVGLAAVFWGIVLTSNEKIIIDKNNKIIIFCFGFSKSEKYQRSLEFIKDIKVYVQNDSIFFDINYGEYNEVIKHYITSRGVTLIKRRVKKIEKIIKKELEI